MIVFILFWLDFVSASKSWNKGCLPKESWKNETVGRFESFALQDQIGKDLVCSLQANRLSWVYFFLVESNGMCVLSDIAIHPSECEQVPEQNRIVGYTKLLRKKGILSINCILLDIYLINIFQHAGFLMDLELVKETS